jgi:hypothetical protein
MRNQSSVQVVCAEYQWLLAESQLALTSLANERAEISGRRGRDIYNELRTLQMGLLESLGAAAKPQTGLRSLLSNLDH